jgi:methyl-accepting chemotaxis protein
MFISRDRWNALTQAIYSISERIYDMAGTLDDLNAEIQKLSATANDTAARVQQQQAASAAAAAALQTIIDDLRAHPAAADLTQQIADLETVNNAVNAIAQPTAPPTP